MRKKENTKKKYAEEKQTSNGENVAFDLVK